MIVLKHHNTPKIYRWIGRSSNQTTIPDCWEDLTPEQYLRVINLVTRVTNNTNFRTLRLQLLEAITGYKRSKKGFTKEEQETINCNLVIISDMLGFPIRPEYTDKQVFNVLSPELKKELEQKFPFEIDNPEWTKEIKRMDKWLKYEPVINLNMKKNPLPTIRHNGKKYTGPVFNVDSAGILHTNITISQYIDAIEYKRLYAATNDINHIVAVVAVFYNNHTQPYTTFQAQQNIEIFRTLPARTIQGISVFHDNITEFFKQHPVYKYMYTGKDRQGKINLGMGTMIDSMIKEGFGNRSEIMNMDVGSFHTLFIKQLQDSIEAMRAYDTKDNEIAKKMELPLELISQL